MVSFSRHGIFLLSVLPPGFRGCHVQLQSPPALASCSGGYANRNRMRLGKNVIFLRRPPRIFALASRGITTRGAIALVTGLRQCLRRPAEPALLIALAGRRRATVGRGGVLAVGIVKRAVRCAR